MAISTAMANFNDNENMNFKFEDCNTKLIIAEKVQQLPIK
jgi:hypothetical protein